MKKIVRVDYRANKELVSFSNQVQNEFKASFRALELKGKLDFPEARKLTQDLYEVRISLEGAYRGFYAYIGKGYIVVLHLFRKRTQKTPIKNLKLANKRLKNYEN